MTIALVSSVCVSAVVGVTSTLPGRSDAGRCRGRRRSCSSCNRNATPSVLPLTPSSLKASIFGEIELRLPTVDADGGEAVARLVVELGGVQQRLGGDAADVEAGAAEASARFSTHGDLHAELGRADGADVAAGAGADDDEIVGSAMAVPSRDTWH